MLPCITALAQRATLTLIPLQIAASPYTYAASTSMHSTGTIGDVIWTNTVNPPAGNVTVSYVGEADPTTQAYSLKDTQKQCSG